MMLVHSQILLLQQNSETLDPRQLFTIMLQLLLTFSYQQRIS